MWLRSSLFPFVAIDTSLFANFSLYFPFSVSIYWKATLRRAPDFPGGFFWLLKTCLSVLRSVSPWSPSGCWRDPGLWCNLWQKPFRCVSLCDPEMPAFWVTYRYSSFSEHNILPHFEVQKYKGHIHTDNLLPFSSSHPPCSSHRQPNHSFQRYFIYMCFAQKWQ